MVPRWCILYHQETYAKEKNSFVDKKSVKELKMSLACDTMIPGLPLRTK